MKARGAVIQGGLAAVGLLVAYATWQRPPEKEAGDVVVVDVSKASLEKIRYEDKTGFVELARIESNGEPVVWLKTMKMQEPPPHSKLGNADAGVTLAAGSKDGGTAALALASPEPAAPHPGPVKEFRGSERAEKLWERFAPLRASRGLGTLAAAKLKELGLETTPRKLELVAGGVQRSFAVNDTNVGLGSQYLRSTPDGQVYLVPASLMSGIEPSSLELIDRRLHAFKPIDYDAFTVAVGPQSREFVQTGADIPQTTKVAPKSAPDKPDEFAKNWHDKIWSRLIVTEVYGKGEQPKTGEPTLALRVEYTLHGRPKGFLDLATASDGKTAYGRTEQTAGWVLLHGGTEQMIQEAKKLVTPGT